MLILTRKLNEVIKIGTDIKVVVRQIGGNRIRLGIEAPRETVILRGELTPDGEASGEATTGDNDEA
jgi:carbon storage regulator